MASDTKRQATVVARMTTGVQDGSEKSNSVYVCGTTVGDADELERALTGNMLEDGVAGDVAGVVLGGSGGALSGLGMVMLGLGGSPVDDADDDAVLLWTMLMRT